MRNQLRLNMLPQPDDTTCGPTCLHAVYRYFEDDLPLSDVIAQTPKLDEGGTLGVYLGTHALQRGYQATIYTYNLRIFDPTWFVNPTLPIPDVSTPTIVEEREVGAACVNLVEKLRSQMEIKDSPKIRRASQAYIEFLQQGGQIRMEDLTGDLLRHYLNQSIPILTGLSSTYLYGHAREIGEDSHPDDVAGLATGHFVVLTGYDRQLVAVEVADPYLPNPLGEEHHYEVDLDRLVCSILLGVLTYDANLLVLQPCRS